MAYNPPLTMTTSNGNPVEDNQKSMTAGRKGPVVLQDFHYFDPFDITKVWSHKDFPLQEIGKMVLNRNPEDYFAETDQVAFSPPVWFPVLNLLLIRCFKDEFLPILAPIAAV
ncbi:hypothetical protein K7432_014680 [Basidiobolus ranarum]|uniref:catalase n=1 Tax=Basidiobolus ranarum TaxID=34480 RepID=A0ABR2VP97_9FUNG